MTWVKICGITNLEDALTAVEAGADALGFVFYERSPRKVKIETTRDIIRQLPDRIEKVGVFVDDEPERIREIVSEAGLTAVQLHGDEDAEFSRVLFRSMSKGLRQPIIFRSCPAHIFDKPADQSLGVGSGIQRPGRARRSVQRQAACRRFTWRKTAIFFSKRTAFALASSLECCSIPQPRGRGGTGTGLRLGVYSPGQG